MATFQQRGSKWLARVRKAGFPSQSTTFSSKRTAQVWAMQLEYGFETGIAGLPDKTTSLADMLERYQKTVTRCWGQTAVLQQCLFLGSGG